MRKVWEQNLLRYLEQRLSFELLWKPKRKLNTCNLLWHRIIILIPKWGSRGIESNTSPKQDWNLTSQTLNPRTPCPFTSCSVLWQSFTFLASPTSWSLHSNLWLSLTYFYVLSELPAFPPRPFSETCLQVSVSPHSSVLHTAQLEPWGWCQRLLLPWVAAQAPWMVTENLNGRTW